MRGYAKNGIFPRKPAMSVPHTPTRRTRTKASPGPGRVGSGPSTRSKRPGSVRTSVRMRSRHWIIGSRGGQSCLGSRPCLSRARLRSLRDLAVHAQNSPSPGDRLHGCLGIGVLVALPPLLPLLDGVAGVLGLHAPPVVGGVALAGLGEALEGAGGE